MTDGADPSGKPATNSADVRVAVGPLAAPLLARVVAMLAARADCSLDRLEDALLVTDALAAHAPAYVTDGHIAMRVQTDPQALQLTVGPLPAAGAAGVLDAARLPGLGNVLERVADVVRVEQAEDGERLVAEIDLRR
jgi:serine/threonine-protein kinase RsbW